MLTGLIAQMKDARTATRQAVANYVLEHPESFSQLLGLAFDTAYPLHHKAAWVLERVYKMRPEFLYPHLDSFTRSLSRLQRDSAIRPVAKIGELLSQTQVNKVPGDAVLSPVHIKRMISAAFDWLIGKHAVAVKVYAMQILYNLGQLQQTGSWVLTELTAVLSENLHTSPKAYQARAKHILAQCGK